MTIAPLQLPPLINVPKIDLSGLNQIGDAIAAYRQRATIADALPTMLGQQPQQPQQGTSLATLGQPQQPQQPGAGAPSAPGNASAAIGGMESGGNYSALGPVTPSGDRAYGKYQVMGANIPQWTQDVLGHSLTPQQFLASPQAQDAVFQAKFGQLAQKYGPDGAARAWFAGPAGMNNPNATDQNGTTVGDYATKFQAAYSGPNTTRTPQGMQAATSQPGGAGMQPSPATSSPQPAQPPQMASPNGMPSVPPQTMARIQAMIRAGGPAQQFAMALLQRYVVPQQPVVVPEGGIAVQPITGRVIARGQPRSYAVTAGGALVTPGAPGANGAPAQGAATYQNNTGLLSDQAAALQGQRAMKGDFSVFSQVGRGTIGQLNSEKIINYMATHGATADNLNAAKAALDSQISSTKAFATGSQGNAIRSFDVATNHLVLLRNLAQAMQNGDVQTLNALRNVFREEFGSPLPTTFEAAKPIVAAEITKAVTASNGALGDREKLEEPLNAAGSWGQISGVINNAYLPLMAGQLHGLQRQYEYTTKKTDFDQRLSPNTLALLNGGAQPTLPKVTNRVEANAAIGAARRAIANGKDPKAVNAALQQMGIPPLTGY